MGQIGRNEPCPCGSGKKFKKCCLLRQSVDAFTGADREAALAKLDDFAFRPEFERERLVAGVAFWADWLDCYPEDEASLAMAWEESIEAFLTWFSVDFRLDTGTTVLDVMLSREASRLWGGERQYLERLRDTHLRPYQVVRVKRDEGLRLIDLWTAEQLSVRARLGSRELVAWDLIAARLMRGASGDLVIDGQPYLYPAGTKDVLLRALRRGFREFKRTRPFATPVSFFKRFGMVFHHFWLETVALQPVPQLVTPEGGPFVFARAIFDVRDRDRVTAP